MTLADAIDHPLFKDVKGSKSENFVGNPVDLEFEEMNLDTDTLRTLFLEEIKSFH